MRVIRAWVRRQVGRLARRLRRVGQVRGDAMGIGYIIDPSFVDQASAIHAGLEGALSSVAQFHPVRFRQVSREVSFILVVPQAMRASYSTDPPVCVLEGRFVATFPQQAVAASIVRMATLIRILKSVEDPDPETIARASKISRRIEMSLGRRLPGGADVVARAEQLLEAPVAGLTPQEQYETDFLNRLMEIEAAGLPQALERRLKKRLHRTYGYQEPDEADDPD